MPIVMIISQKKLARKLSWMNTKMRQKKIQNNYEKWAHMESMDYSSLLIRFWYHVKKREIVKAYNKFY